MKTFRLRDFWRPAMGTALLGIVLVFCGCRVSDYRGDTFLVPVPPTQESAYGSIDGKIYGYDDLSNASRRALYQLDFEIFREKRRALEGYLIEYLFKKEATRRGLTVSELLEHEVYKPAAAAGEKEVEAFVGEDSGKFREFLTHEIPSTSLVAPEGSSDLLVSWRGETGQEGTFPFEVLERIVGASLKRRVKDQFYWAYVARLKEGSRMQHLLKPPAPLRQKVPRSVGPFQGKEGGPVHVLEVGSYGDALTAHFHVVMKQILEDYSHQVQWEFLPRLAGGTPSAVKAARTALCAMPQKKFWEVHEVLLNNWASLDLEKWEAFYQEAKVDSKDLQSCLDAKHDGKILQKGEEVIQDLAVGDRLTFFVNGLEIHGVEGPEVLEKAIREETKAKIFLMAKKEKK